MATEQLRTAIHRDAELCPLLTHVCCIAEHSAELHQLELALQTAQEIVLEAKTEMRAKQRDQWHQWLDDHKSRGSGAVFRWVKEGPRPPITLTARCQLDGTWLHGRKQAAMRPGGPSGARLKHRHRLTPNGWGICGPSPPTRPVSA